MKEQQEEKIICHDCGKVIEKPANGCGTGYGIDNDGHTVCYECYGKRDRKELFEAKPGDKFVFYLIEEKNETTGQTDYYVTNWPASLKIKLHATPRKGRHNIAGRRLDVWFIQNGKNFHGTQYGENSQLLYTKCVK